jgi:hypothetical protein
VSNTHELLNKSPARGIYQDLSKTNPEPQKGNPMKPEDIARVCHNANKALCEAFGDTSQVDWDKAEDWQKKSAITGVNFIRDNPNAAPSATHNSWLEEKRRDGWKYGAVKDPVKKEHPCFVPYDQLPPDQKAKDYVFGAIARNLLSYNDAGPYDPNSSKEPASPLTANQASIADATSITSDGKLQTDLSKLTSKPV